MKNRKILEFINTLRDSADIQYKVFLEGSCFRLYLLLKVFFPKAKAYWSDRDDHCIVKISGRYYDIGGEVKPEFIENNNYYKIPKGQLKGYENLKYTSDGPRGAKVEKYK